MQITKIAQGCQGGKQAEFFFYIHLDHESIKKHYTYELFQVPEISTRLMCVYVLWEYQLCTNITGGVNTTITVGVNTTIPSPCRE